MLLFCHAYGHELFQWNLKRELVSNIFQSYSRYEHREVNKTICW